MRVGTLIGFFLGAVALAGIGLAQETRATISGTVVDPGGAVVPAVLITLTNLETNVVTSVLTNEAGLYLFTSLRDL
ncbi:MAG TPA: carboxypeptidase-like regulatory domain-containing protein [Bryobacteraceae bacterium]|nr:carboxypeptidase-like regulatory domain-containing protein [Bryobacteraceae bacterium]